MPGLVSWNLAEPLIEAMVALLSANLNTTIDQLNATYTDGYVVPHAAQVVNYVPVPTTLQGGTPVIGVQEMPSEVQDDIVTSAVGVHHLAVVATIQNADHQTLVTHLRRMIQAIAFTVQADRIQTSGTTPTGIMRTQGGAWEVTFTGTVPGPLLGDADPTSPDGPPRSFLSYTAITFQCHRYEV